MRRWSLGFWVCLVAAPVWGFEVSALGDRLDWSPLVASLSPIALVAFVGWLARGRELIAVFAAAVAVAYGAFIGLALARAIDANVIALGYGAGPLRHNWPVPITSWPLVLFAGIAYAFVFAILAALPASRLVARPQIDAEMDQRFWTFVKEHTQPDERSP